MTPRYLVMLAALVLTGPAHAAGDAAAGESTFKKCRACHSIIADDGTVIQKGGKTGPNLFGVIGRVIGSTDFNYSPTFKEAEETGLVWDQSNLAAYVTDPKGWLQEETGDASARTKMSFKLKKGQEDIAAYLASVAP